MNRIIVEYPGFPYYDRDALIDKVAERLGLHPGDTGFSFPENVRDHSIDAGEDRAAAYALVTKFRQALPEWATVRIWPEDDA